MRQPIATQTLECTVCGEQREFSLFGPAAGVRDPADFERALQAEADEVVALAKAWAAQHEHGATARGLGEA